MKKIQKIKIGSVVYIQGRYKGVVKEVNENNYGVIPLEGILDRQSNKVFNYSKDLIFTKKLK